MRWRGRGDAILREMAETRRVSQAACRELLRLSGAPAPLWQDGGQRVCVALSGGVDSTMTALLLQGAGHEVSDAVFMQNWDPADESDVNARQCPIEQEWRDAQLVAEHLGLPSLRRVEYVSEYWQRVFEPFLEQLELGVCTPNPDVLCNREIKFDTFMQDALGGGADFVATGHYARTVATPSGSTLGAGDDRCKDQSYFLAMNRPKCWERTVFPMGALSKEAVRECVEALGLGFVMEKRSSRGICFIGKRRFSDFASGYIDTAQRRGPVLCGDTGEQLSEHAGLALTTIGQRVSVHDLPCRYYAAKKIGGDVNAIVAVKNPQHPLMFAQEVHVAHVVWQVTQLQPTAQSPPLGSKFMARAKFRYNEFGTPVECTVDSPGSLVVRVTGDGAHAVTPGQVCSLYVDIDTLERLSCDTNVALDGGNDVRGVDEFDVCVAGGIIARTLRDGQILNDAGFLE
ncbi:MAG: hypothetical protein MHM6MM_002653 [Cercozoa sp. M6MM]